MTRMDNLRVALVALAAVGVVASAGCRRPPAVEIENLPLVASLRTACSARSEQWLSGVERAVAQRVDDGRMSAIEKSHFDKLISQARSGDWQGAEKLCYSFERAQLNRTRQRTAPDEHAHAHPPAVRQVSVNSGR